MVSIPQEVDQGKKEKKRRKERLGRINEEDIKSLI